MAQPGNPPFTGKLCFNRGCLYEWVDYLASSHGSVAYMLLVFAFASEMEGLGTFASVVLMSSRPLCILWSSSVRSRCSYGLDLLLWISPMDQRSDYAVRYVASMPSPQECSAVRPVHDGLHQSLAPYHPVRGCRAVPVRYLHLTILRGRLHGRHRAGPTGMLLPGQPSKDFQNCLMAPTDLFGRDIVLRELGVNITCNSDMPDDRESHFHRVCQSGCTFPERHHCFH